jgi:hypothetical protein
MITQEVETSFESDSWVEVTGQQADVVRPVWISRAFARQYSIGSLAMNVVGKGVS